MSDKYSNLPVSELKRILEERNVSYKDCLEKSELIARAVSTEHLQPQRTYPYYRKQKLAGTDCILIDTAANPGKLAGIDH